MKIHPIIFNWKGQTKKTLQKEQQLVNLGFRNVSVINSDEDTQPEHWVNLSDQDYFTDQFLKALEVFDGDFLFHIQGDVSSDKWEEIMLDALNDFNKVNWGVYAPNIDYTGWNGRWTNISNTIEGRTQVACTDCSCWLVHKDIIEEFKSLKLDMKDQHLGFGIDMLICAISHLNNRPVIRNYNFKVDHPKGTGYNVDKAHQELKQLLIRLPHRLRKTIFYIHRNTKVMRRNDWVADLPKTVNP